MEGGSALVDLGAFQSKLAETLFITNFTAEKFEALAGRVGSELLPDWQGKCKKPNAQTTRTRRR